MKPISPIFVAVLFVLLIVPAADGGQVAKLPSFQNGTTADADQINQAFGTLATEINDNDSRISALESAGGGADQVIQSQGLQPSANGTVWGVYGQYGSEDFSRILLPRTGTIEGFFVRASAGLNVGASVSVTLRLNNAPVAGPLVFTAVDGTTMKSDATVINVSAGDMMTFEFSETGGTSLGASMHAAVILK